MSCVDTTLVERAGRHGEFTDVARACQRLKAVMTVQHGWSKLSDVQKQALEVIMDKIARILSGDPNYPDHWHDIQGYAKVVEIRLPSDSGYQDEKKRTTTATRLLSVDPTPTRPPCYNRPPFADGRWLGTGRRSANGKPIERWHYRWFEQRCAIWDGTGIGPNGERYPDAHGWDCNGCRWKP